MTDHEEVRAGSLGYVKLAEIVHIGQSTFRASPPVRPATTGSTCLLRRTEALPLPP